MKTRQFFERAAKHEEEKWQFTVLNPQLGVRYICIYIVMGNDDDDDDLI